MRKTDFAFAKTKTQISCAVTAEEHADHRPRNFSEDLLVLWGEL